MNEIVKIKRELEQLKSGLKCLLSLFPAATQWTPEHTIANNYKYLENTLVWHQGCIYKCKKDNSGADIQDEYFWEKIGFGLLLAQEQADWNATEGPSYIRNKPWNLGGQEQDPLFTAWLNSNPLSSYVTFNQASNSFYPLNSNPSGYLTSAALSGYATQSWVGNNFYPLNSNPSGYLTQQRVEEYPDFASFPLVGEDEVVYIAADTGLFYSWNGTVYVPSSPPASGISGGGIINRLPKFTPDGTTLGSSNFSDSGTEGRYSKSATNFISFYPAGNIWMRLQRVPGNIMDLILGNSGISQTASLTASNAYGLEIVASSVTAFLALKAGGFEGLRVLPTGKILLPQNPDPGNNATDKMLVRDPSGNIKQLPLKNKRYEIEYEDNFYSNSASAGSTFALVNISGITSQQIFTSGIFTPPSFDSTTGNLLQLSTSTNAAGLASITLGSQNNPGSFFPGQGEFMMETKVTFPALSTVSESFMYMFGLHTTGNVVSNDVISFKYDPERIFAFGAGPATGNLVTCTSNLNNRTFTDTGIVVNVNQWYWLKIIVNSTASEARFYINNILVATHTTNITLTGKHLTNIIRKNAGTTPRVVHVRYMYFGHTPTNPIHL